MDPEYGYVCKLSTISLTPPKKVNNDGDETFLESHALSLLPLSPFLDTPTSGGSSGRSHATVVVAVVVDVVADDAGGSSR